MYYVSIIHQILDFFRNNCVTLSNVQLFYDQIINYIIKKDISHLFLSSCIFLFFSYFAQIHKIK